MLLAEQSVAHRQRVSLTIQLFVLHRFDFRAVERSDLPIKHIYIRVTRITLIFSFFARPNHQNYIQI